jgi:hypothetical protein
VPLTTILAKLISWANNIAGRETSWRKKKVMMNPIVGLMARKFTATKKWKKQLTHNKYSYIYCSYMPLE